LYPTIAHVIRISDPGNCFSFDRSDVLYERENVSKNLTGMVIIGQAIDHRNC